MSNVHIFYLTTGAGKTHTMLGNQDYPGVMFYTMMELYRRIDELKDDKICEVAVSYCEVRRRGREREREREGGGGGEREREREREREGGREGERERERDVNLADSCCS